MQDLENGEVLFVGGFKHFNEQKNRWSYCLSFVVPSSDSDNRFGYSVAQCWVMEKEYEDFHNNIYGYNVISADVRYIRGGWSLLSYDLE